MIRFVVVAALMVVAGAPAVAQTTASAQQAQQAVAQQHVDRINLLQAKLSEATALYPSFPNPPPTEREAARTVMRDQLAQLKTSRPALDKIRTDVAALPQLAPSNIEQIDKTSAMITAVSKQLLDADAELLADFEGLFAASLAGDSATADRLAPKTQRAAVLILDSSAVSIRALKVVAAAGDPVESAKFEAIAVTVEATGAILSLRLGLTSQTVAAGRLQSAAKAIRDQLPTARSEMVKDARTFGDPPIGGIPPHVQVYRAEWKMLEKVEQFAGLCDQVGARLAAGNLPKQDVDAIAAQLRALNREIVASGRGAQATLN